MKKNANLPTIKNPRVLNTLARQLDKAQPCRKEDTAPCLKGDVFDYEAICPSCQDLVNQMGALLPDNDEGLVTTMNRMQYTAYIPRLSFLLIASTLHRMTDITREAVKIAQAEKIEKVITYLQNS